MSNKIILKPTTINQTSEFFFSASAAKPVKWDNADIVILKTNKDQGQESNKIEPGQWYN